MEFAVFGEGVNAVDNFLLKGINLYVMWPDEDSVSEAAEKIRETMN